MATHDRPVPGHDRLPPLQALAFFEAAARHLNFTAAAHELGATQPAVSHRVREVEDHLGVALFRRLHRGVALTDEGARLFEAVGESLRAIRAAAAEIRARRARNVLSLVTDFGFAAHWIMPRLPRLREALPELELRITTTQYAFDLLREPADFAIEFGSGQWDGCEAELLFPEIAVPVCSPGFLAAHGPIREASDLAALPLLHLEAVEPARWVSWDDWFAAQGVGRAGTGRNIHFNDYSFIIQAAMAGQGVALGWRPLVDELLDNGLLATALDLPIRTSRGYFLVSPLPALLTSVQSSFRDWLLDECRSSESANA